jgi:hypothetical protein
VGDKDLTKGHKMKPQKRLSEQQVNDCMKLTALMRRAFTWEDTPEGFKYWSDICAKINWMAFYQTTDRKLYRDLVVWRTPIDEDAKLRPLCRVRDSERQNWIMSDKTLLAVVDDASYPFVTSHQAADGLITVVAYKFCEIIDDTKTDSAA